MFKWNNNNNNNKKKNKHLKLWLCSQIKKKKNLLKELGFWLFDFVEK